MIWFSLLIVIFLESKYRIFMSLQSEAKDMIPKYHYLTFLVIIGFGPVLLKEYFEN